LDIKAYIASGILELYVAGSLSEKENQEVYEATQKYPEILAEVKAIEAIVVKLTAAANNNSYNFSTIASKLENTTKVIPITRNKNSWKTYLGWVASVILGGLFVWSLNQNNTLKEEIANEKEILQQKIDSTNKSLAETEKILDIIRDKDVISVPLAGQQVSPTSYAKVYWDKKTNAIYLDAKGLPEPPKGKVYQVWSLKLSPLTPTSLGTLDTFTADNSKIFTINNPNESEAFGITLEPEGGSESPTLEQLYTLGAVSTP